MQTNYEIMSIAKRKCMSKSNMDVTWTGREERREVERKRERDRAHKCQMRWRVNSAAKH